MTFKIEKETRWKASELKSEMVYFVWAGAACLAACNTEEEAKVVFEAAKKNYIKSETVVVLQEEVDL